MRLTFYLILLKCQGSYINSFVLLDSYLMSSFAAWITQRFLDWQSSTGRRKTIDEFAAYIGVSRPLLNMWMNGNQPRPGKANIKLLAEIFGDELYDVLELPRPDPLLRAITTRWPNIPAEKQRKLAEDAALYEAQAQKTKQRLPKHHKSQTDP